METTKTKNKNICKEGSCPVIWESEVGEDLTQESRASVGNVVRPLLKNKDEKEKNQMVFIAKTYSTEVKHMCMYVYT